jgi:phosphoribosyl 1,2-cyclic phosphate phosphodiesterase
MIDASVDFAEGILYTHGHADHIHGIDDLRGFAINRRRRVQIYADVPTAKRLHDGFGYCFKTPEGGSYPPILEDNRIAAGEMFAINGPGGTISVMPFRQLHGDISSLGFRFDDVAYSSDISGIPDESLPLLEGLDTWIVDALQYREHPSHFSLDQALHWIAKLKPKRAVLTHMHTPLDYDDVANLTPEHVIPAYDGMRFVVDCPGTTDP